MYCASTTTIVVLVLIALCVCGDKDIYLEQKAVLHLCPFLHSALLTCTVSLHLGHTTAVMVAQSVADTIVTHIVYKTCLGVEADIFWERSSITSVGSMILNPPYKDE